MNSSVQFDSALYGVPQRIRRVLLFLPESLKGRTEEIRLRAGRPVALTVNGRPMFLAVSGAVSEYITRNLLICEKSEIDEAFRLLCRSSVYAHTEEIKNGYIAMSCGHRAGICGTVTKEGMRDISSVNIRIARQITGCADALADCFDGGGILIAGPPGSGKTTMLRDVIRQLSGTEKGRYMRIAVIDSRFELSASCGGECFNDLGLNTDVLLTPDKASGALMALRTMYPDIIAFDEIGTASELDSVSECFNAGVAIITTAHIGERDDLLRRSVTRRLLEGGAVSRVAVLPPDIHKSAEIFSSEELLSELNY